MSESCVGVSRGLTEFIGISSSVECELIKLICVDVRADPRVHPEDNSTDSQTLIRAL